MTISRSNVRDGSRKSTGTARQPVVVEMTASSSMADSAARAKPKTPTKGDLLVALLRRPSGVTAAQMSEAVGWQVHSVRGFIAGAVKKQLGLAVTTGKVDGQTVYRIVDKAAA